MAQTAYGVNANEAVKLWSRKLMREALKQTYASKFMGTGSDSLCQILDDTSKGPGDRIRVILRMQLGGAGVQGDGTLEGNEEALVTYTDDVVINQLRHAVRSAGKMTEQRIPFSVREEARMGLQDWWADRYDTWFFNAIAGNSAQTDTRYTGNNTVTAPDATHQIFANGHTTEASMTSTASCNFSLSLIDQAVLKARTLSPVMRPVNTETGQKYVMFITPEQHYDLRRNTNTLEWGDIQKAAMQGGNISDNPIFSGALGEYNGVILHESTRLPRITSTGGSLVGRSVMCGAQAAVFAFGRDNSPNRMSWVEEIFDYGNQLGVSAGCIAGVKKTVYNSQDFSTIVVSAGHSAASESANGR
jgi:N4-gp56 family major capsid protein